VPAFAAAGSVAYPLEAPGLAYPMASGGHAWVLPAAAAMWPSTAVQSAHTQANQLLGQVGLTRRAFLALPSPGLHEAHLVLFVKHSRTRGPYLTAMTMIMRQWWAVPGGGGGGGGSFPHPSPRLSS
jgi:hypothetical protein